MSPLLAPGNHVLAVPRFYVTPRQRLSPASFVLGLFIALFCLAAVLHALAHARNAHYSTYGSGHAQSGRTGFQDSATADDADPSRIDTVCLGGPGEAPVPARPATKPSAVHPFVVVHLPRSGDELGQIPDTPAGRLLYGWLAAFNNTDVRVVAKALPTPEATQTEAAQVELRKQTGGFTLVSSREVQPGLLVFRLHDQTPSATEVLGTLAMRPNSNPPAIASFSLRAVPGPEAKVR